MTMHLALGSLIGILCGTWLVYYVTDVARHYLRNRDNGLDRWWSLEQATHRHAAVGFVFLILGLLECLLDAFTYAIGAR